MGGEFREEFEGCCGLSLGVWVLLVIEVFERGNDVISFIEVGI